MEVEFADESLDRAEVDPSYDAGMAPGVAKAFRKRMQAIRAAPDERDFRAMRSWRFEKLQGARQHQHSMRLNDQYRLIIELVGQGPRKRVRIVAVEDYH